MSFAAKLTPAIRSVKGTWHLRCHVKPGVSSSRLGIIAVTEDAVEVGVAEQAKNGEANDAVVHVICRALHAPRDEVRIVRGWKSRVKTVVVSPSRLREMPTESAIDRIKQWLWSASIGK
ncbi:hypothetical protein IAQ61_006422 [Plenodomus lingam]|uniref:Similar to DUF167 domain protein n=1 Tax=Leptosphaeria maculans (strain JN3 / isolate v23.1.3 / race Av1-4-5-6-7-8) TaxID=985895 RepID=E5AF39_LEPMJ|nr:similar to DUF167 domain protein [Plenodomus lingam JN3]KAH9869217.1 hypothetical protein IAQ61_006422 [Plenodomus lingam]CBY01828.1 similar to DUF167 domain protein [Plenodomus lingam JN3]